MFKKKGKYFLIMLRKYFVSILLSCFKRKRKKWLTLWPTSDAVINMKSWLRLTGDFRPVRPPRNAHCLTWQRAIEMDIGCKGSVWWRHHCRVLTVPDHSTRDQSLWSWRCSRTSTLIFLWPVQHPRPVLPVPTQHRGRSANVWRCCFGI